MSYNLPDFTNKVKQNIEARNNPTASDGEELTQANQAQGSDINTPATIPTSTPASPLAAIPADLKKLLEYAGAIKAFETVRAFSADAQIELIFKLERDKVHLAAGYTNFAIFCGEVLGIGSTKLHEMKKFRKRFTQELYLALVKVGLKRKDLLALAECGDIETVAEPEETPAVIYLNEKIACTPENAGKLQKILKTIQKTSKQISHENLQLKQEIGLLQDEVKDLLDFNTKLETVEKKFYFTLPDMKRYKELAKVDKDHMNSFRSWVAKLDSWWVDTKEDLLDEIIPADLEPVHYEDKPGS